MLKSIRLQFASKVVFVISAMLGLMSLATFADVGVTVLVILNGLRLLNFK